MKEILDFKGTYIWQHFFEKHISGLLTFCYGILKINYLLQNCLRFFAWPVKFLWHSVKVLLTRNSQSYSTNVGCSIFSNLTLFAKYETFFQRHSIEIRQTSPVLEFVIFLGIGKDWIWRHSLILDSIHSQDSHIVTSFGDHIFSVH